MSSNHSCVFCNIASGKLPKVEIYSDDLCMVIMDIFPISHGHVMVIPKQHAKYVEDLPSEIQEHIFKIGSKVSAAIRKSKLNVNATHFLLNNGTEANQHVPHVHLHIIPRYKRDLIQASTHLITRFFNPLAKIGKKKKLDKLAETIQKSFNSL
jgi:histidine triad (HIT) family protein